MLGLSLAAFMGTFIGVLLLLVGMKYAKAGVAAAALSSTSPILVDPHRPFLFSKKGLVGKKSPAPTAAVLGIAPDVCELECMLVKSLALRGDPRT